MNKSLTTNSLSAILCMIGILIPDTAFKPYVLSAGLFSLSGALTNWLAIHMLFEKIPGLYGSGVIVDRFEDFKRSIYALVMENFFTEENFRQFTDVAFHQSLSSETIEEKIDLDQAFNGFLEVIAESKFGSLLAFVGGVRALEPLREPFKVEFKNRLSHIVEKLDLTKGDLHYERFRPTVEKLVEGKLDQLQPVEVKTLLEKIIRDHLGWLVVWGGVFGGLIGIVAATFRL